MHGFSEKNTTVATWRVAVIGIGLMGGGLAELFARNGHHLRLFDTNSTVAANKAADLQQRGYDAEAAATVDEAATGCELVVEVVAEQLNVKRRLLATIGAVNPDAIIVSNTSTFLPSSLADALPRPEQLLVAHFFNPALHVPLVEIVESSHTDRALTEKVLAFLRRVGKTPVLLKAETPGFVANRLQAAVLREALALVRAGVASYEQIDEIMRSSLGPRWSVAGPFQIADLGGLDVFAALTEQLFPELDESRTPPPEITDKVAAGHLGVKSGGGFYELEPDEVRILQQRITAAFGA